MNRREFIAGLGGAAAWPLAARAQRAGSPIVGYLGGGNLESSRDRVTAFQRGLAATGYVVGENVSIEFSWADYHTDRFRSLAADLVRRRVDVIAMVGGGMLGALALKEETRTIPIVFVMGADPVESGVVASLNRPGGNITGISVLDIAVAAKRLEALHEFVPRATPIGFLSDPNSTSFSARESKELQAAARLMGVDLVTVKAGDPSEFEVAFGRLGRERAQGLIVSSTQLFSDHPARLVELAARARLPTIYARREPTLAGGLMSLGTDFADAFRQVGVYTGRILKGEKPADLPVQLVTQMRLTINLNTAKALGIAFPQTLLVRADEVIE
jgi:putative tryptophan/tyrosine transport system substrate-binding protein